MGGGALVQVRTDRKLPQFADDESPAFGVLRSILLTYSFYNFDLGYCQVGGLGLHKQC